MPNAVLLRMLALSILSAPQQPKEIAAAGGRLLGRNWRWLTPLAHRYLAHFAIDTRPRQALVVAFLQNDAGLREASAKYGSAISIARWLTEPQTMQPVEAARSWDVPSIESTGALSDWLQLNPGELEWFVDRRALNSSGKLQHYNYRFFAKRTGAIRVIEVPKSRLRSIQRKIHEEILTRIPPHDAAHGFVRGRSIQTFTAPHIGQHVVLRMDLSNFFPSLSRARIAALFRTAGYPENVADALAGICTNRMPRSAWHRDSCAEERQTYTRSHLPQGAPSSPALANACMYRIDCRLSALARAAGAVYTRYADDLAFSGDDAFERHAHRFALHAAAVVMDEGFDVNFRKTRLMRRGVRQRLAGLVVNDRINVPREQFDHLKAVLTNCVRDGAETQNRENHADFRSHLHGRVAFVESINAVRGAKLRRLFEQINWDQRPRD